MIKRKLLTGTIVLTTLCSTLVPYSAFAANENASQSQSTNFEVQKVKYSGIEYDYQILKDDEDTRKVKVTAEDGTSVVEYNKKTGEYTLVDSKGKEFKEKIQPKIASTKSTFTLAGVDITNIYSQSESVWGSKCKVDKYVYTNPSSTKYVWYVATSTTIGKSVMESTSNLEDLNGFKSAVKTTKTKELEAAAALGTAYAAAIAALLTAAPTAGMSAVLAILASVGAVGTGAVLLWQAFDAHNDAVYYYKRV